MRLIDADDLLIELGSYHVGGIEAIINYNERRHRNEWTEGLHTAWRTIDDAPTIDAEPVRHGHWYDEPNYLGTSKTMFFCSVCGSASWREDPYCWHCGSKMDLPDTDVGKMEVMK